MVVLRELTRSSSVTLFESFSPSSSCTSVRSTTRSPSASVTSGNCRRRLSSPRSTSITRIPGCLKIETSIAFAPISGEPSGTTTSVKYFIRLRLPSRSAIESRFGRKRGTRIHMVAKPAIITQNPSGAISKSPKGTIPCARATPSTSRFVEVPIIVIIPPSTVWYDSGISSFDGASPIECASCTVTGIITATSGVLLVKAEATAMKSPTSVRTSTLFCAARRETIRAKLLISPVRTSPPDTMNIAAIVQGAGFEKTFSTPSEGTTPAITSTAAPSIAVTSTGKTSATKTTNMTASTATVNQAATPGCAMKSLSRSVSSVGPRVGAPPWGSGGGRLKGAAGAGFAAAPARSPPASARRRPRPAPDSARRAAATTRRRRSR